MNVRGVPAGGGSAAASRQHTVAVVVLSSTLALDLAMPVQAFGAAIFTQLGHQGSPPYEVVLCGEVSTISSATLGFALGGLAPVETITTADTVLVPGIQEPLTAQHPAVLQAVREAARSGSRMISLCSGAFVLGQAGFLDGRRVTTHWGLANEFRASFPRSELVESVDYVDDGQILSSGGMLGAADLCLHVLRADLGAAYSDAVAPLLICARDGVSAMQPAVPSLTRAREGSLTPLIGWLTEHLHEDLDLQRVAARAHLSTRTLVRQFRAQTGSTFKEWITQQRIEAARSLLESTDLSVYQVAHATGFGSPANMRRAFVLHLGISPRDYRSADHHRYWLHRGPIARPS